MVAEKSSKYMEEILTEMFRIVGAEYSKKFLEQDQWYTKYEWTEEQQLDFEKWLYNYLKTNKEAKKHYFRRTIVSDKVLKDSVSYFMFHCGWKFKESE